MSEDEKKSSFSRGHDGSIFEVDGRIGEDNFDELLIWCSEKGASDITIQPNLPVIADIGGKLVKVTQKSLQVPEVDGIVRYIYGENGPAEIKSGFDLDPSHEIRVPGGRMRFRVNITGGRSSGQDGIQITVRTLPDIPLHIDTLNVEPAILENFRPKDGMVLVTGPTGSGKSTLLSSGLRMVLEDPDANEKVLEYSKPVEYVYDKVEMPSSVVFQTDVGKHLRPRAQADEASEFAYCVRNALRRKPTIITIGEARDKATIEACVEASLTGHLMYSTMHTIGVAETLRRAVTPFPGDERRAMAIDILEVLRMIVTQILLPREGGGKVACREFMVFDDDTREKVLAAEIDDWPKVIRRLLAEGNCIGQSMADCAIGLHDQGLISKNTLRHITKRET
ncbi:ATPase, T2SS/T4P/T4SS family [Sulfitobacter sp. R18_1]|uniref:type IV pilus twitching motility protein PilT n=1 Tax=Sulfitobacter sp. R18_1 TaxID=2821104 RepID=UPI001ADAC450|nr:ATPase, T2SS/T4P/T4SS family [Sulfitobacter sp. R18_1]MBO9428664.1 Flp pilus assembly complex ATPase component TadA [Sulfitobacter sp. R18_1]